jgi:hypothetical protein
MFGERSGQGGTDLESASLGVAIPGQQCSPQSTQHEAGVPVELEAVTQQERGEG